MDNGRHFDEYIKAGLEDGVEDVPASLWENVRARIQTPAKGVVWWRRALVGTTLAGIALVAGVLFLPETPVSEQADNIVKDRISEAFTPTTAASALSVPATIVPVSAAASESDATAFETPTPESEADATAFETPATETVPAENNTDIPARDAPAVTCISPYNPSTAFLPEEEKPAGKGRLEMAVNANGAENIGGHSYGYGRLTTSRMNFDREGALTEEEATNYMVPLSVGMAVRYNFSPKWALSVGLNYTYLNRHFKGIYDYGGIETFICDDVNNDQHFIGIPINAFYTICSGERLKFYASFGGAVEKCLVNRYSFNYYRKGKTLYDKVAGLQASVNVGVGLQVNLTKRMGIYLDPGIRYYFKDYRQPKSIRTVQPVQFGAELGLRWDL